MKQRRRECWHPVLSMDCTAGTTVSSSPAVGSRSCEPLPSHVSEVANFCARSGYGKRDPPLSSPPRAAGFLRLIGHRLMTLHASARPQRQFTGDSFVLLIYNTPTLRHCFLWLEFTTKLPAVWVGMCVCVRVCMHFML